MASKIVNRGPAPRGKPAQAAPPPRQPQRPAPAPQQRPAPQRPAQAAPAEEERRRPAPAAGNGQSRAVAARPQSAPPAELARMAADDVGKGVSKDTADNLVPMIYVLQAQSPQVNPRNPAYMEGAEQGMFWLRGDATYDGETDGLEVQPCYFSKCVNEWIPRESGGGFVARHKEMPEDAERVVDVKNPNRVSWRSRRTGNQYVETREHILRVFLPDGRKMPFVLPFSSTGHTVSRGWMTMMNGKLMDDGGTYPSFAHTYVLRTKFTQNQQGEWFKIEVHDGSWVTPEDYRLGKQLHDAFASGAKEVDASGYGAAEGEEDLSGGQVFESGGQPQYDDEAI